MARAARKEPTVKELAERLDTLEGRRIERLEQYCSSSARTTEPSPTSGTPRSWLSSRS
jgi:hypothetical protein